MYSSKGLEIMTKDRNKLERAITALSVLLGIGLFADAIILAVVSICCLMLSFSLFFMAAVPAFLLFGALCLFTFFASFVDIAIGIALHFASKKNEFATRAISIAMIVTDAVTIPVNITVFILATFITGMGVTAAWVFIYLFSVMALVASVARLVLCIVRALRRKSAAVPLSGEKSSAADKEPTHD